MKLLRRMLPALLAASVLLVAASCAGRPAGEMGTEIIEAKAVATLLAQAGTVLVDTRAMPDYNEGHISGAVNISRADIVVNQPFANLLAPAAQIEQVMGSRGISNDTLVVIYDNAKNMDAARLWWTLKIYGHDKVKVVSGGWDAMKKAAYKIDTVRPSLSAASFKAGALRSEMIITAADLRAALNEPKPELAIIDTRTEEEYMEGTIPGSVLIDYVGNNFADNTYKPVPQIRIKYLEAGIGYGKEIVMFCKTSIRGAQTFLALYNAGYRNLKLYDGAWVEWSANPMNPVFVPEPEVLELKVSDQS